MASIPRSNHPKLDPQITVLAKIEAAKFREISQQAVHAYRLTLPRSQAHVAAALLRDPNIVNQLAAKVMGKGNSLVLYPMLPPELRFRIMRAIGRLVRELARQQPFDVNNPYNPDSALSIAQATAANNLTYAAQEAAAQQDQNNIEQANLEAQNTAALNVTIEESEDSSLKNDIAIAAATLGGYFVLQDQENIPHDLQELQNGTKIADDVAEKLENGEKPHQSALESLIKDLIDFAKKDSEAETPNPEKEAEHEASNLPTPRPGG